MFLQASPEICDLSLPSALWPGWSGMENLVVFGDSYSTTGFNITLTQPSISNPLGNPEYPGYTSSNGPNWVDFLTTEYNESLIQTLNLAYGGATVDSDLVAPYLPTVLSMEDQVVQEFMPFYANQTNDLFPWTSETTVFASVSDCLS